MSMEELIAVEERIKDGFINQAQGFLEILDDKLFLSAEFATFDDYCDERLNCGASYGYRMAKAGRLVNRLVDSPIGRKWLPSNERQARELARLPEDQVEEAIEVIVGYAPKKAGEPQVTAEHIKETLLQQKFIRPRRKVSDQDIQRQVDQAKIRMARRAIDDLASLPWSGTYFIEHFGIAQLGDNFPFVCQLFEEIKAAQKDRLKSRGFG